MSTLRDRILEANDTTAEVVDVPEWGDAKVEVRSMTGRDRARFMASARVDGDMNWERMLIDVIIHTAYDPETGDQVFGMADRDALAAKNGAALQRLSSTAMRLAGFSQEAVAEAEADLGPSPN